MSGEEVTVEITADLRILAGASTHEAEAGQVDDDGAMAVLLQQVGCAVHQGGFAGLPGVEDQAVLAPTQVVQQVVVGLSGDIRRCRCRKGASCLKKAFIHASQLAVRGVGSAPRHR